MYPICSASADPQLAFLRSLHKLGVEHGDLHAGNILVAADGRVMLLDFDRAEVGASAKALEEEGRLLLGDLAMKQGWAQVHSAETLVTRKLTEFCDRLSCPKASLVDTSGCVALKATSGQQVGHLQPQMHLLAADTLDCHRSMSRSSGLITWAVLCGGTGLPGVPTWAMQIAVWPAAAMR